VKAGKPEITDVLRDETFSEFLGNRHRSHIRYTLALNNNLTSQDTSNSALNENINARNKRLMLGCDAM
jgi:hypothetical protein